MAVVSKTTSSKFDSCHSCQATLVQLVERRVEAANVVGSNPMGGTMALWSNGYDSGFVIHLSGFDSPESLHWKGGRAVEGSSLENYRAKAPWVRIPLFPP